MIFFGNLGSFNHHKNHKKYFDNVSRISHFETDIEITWGHIQSKRDTNFSTMSSPYLGALLFFLFYARMHV